MGIPSRHSKVRSSNLWQDAFGHKTTIDEVLNYILAHWAYLQKVPPYDMQFHQREPKITKFFAKSLDQNKRDHGIWGFFIPEYCSSNINTEKQIHERPGRTDMTYLSEKVDPPIELDIEFKKLVASGRSKASRGAYFNDGVARFSNGIYAKKIDVGFMIGLVEKRSEADSVLDGLMQGIQEKAMVQLLRMHKIRKTGKNIVAPAETFHQCVFETWHARDHVPDCTDVMVGHFILVHEV